MTLTRSSQLRGLQLVRVAGRSAAYPPVPVNAFLDAGFSWVLPVNGAPRWSLNATNLLDNQVASFVGVPKIGRMIMTRIAYTY